MSVKLSTSRLRTAPGMGERAGCYRCGQEGHWSKECPMDQNGSYREGPGSAGYGPLRFGTGGECGGRGFHRGYSGEPAFGDNFSHGFSRGAGYGVPGYGRGAGFESAVSYGMPAGYGIGADNSMAPAYGSEAAYGSSGVAYGGAMPAYPMRRTPYEESDPYGVVDFYEKYRARPYGASYFEDRRAVPPPVPPPPSSSAVVRERLSSSNHDPYERHPLPPPPAPTSSYYVRERSPIRRAPQEAEVYAYERSRLSPVSSLPRSSAYDVPRDPYAATRYAY